MDLVSNSCIARQTATDWTGQTVRRLTRTFTVIEDSDRSVVVWDTVASRVVIWDRAVFLSRILTVQEPDESRATGATILTRAQLIAASNLPAPDRQRALFALGRHADPETRAVIQSLQQEI